MAAGRDAAAMARVGPLIAMLSDFDAVAFAASVTWTVKPEVPAAVGVPETVEPLSVSPAGSEPDWIVQV